MAKTLQRLSCHFSQLHMLSALTQFFTRAGNGAGINFRPSRLRALLLVFGLVVVMAFTPASPVMAQVIAPTAITWDDLQSETTHLSNPYEHLSTEQTYRLSNLYQLREWAKENQPAPDSVEVQSIQRLEKSFADEGLDPDQLLVHADAAREYWQSQSRITNPDVEDRSVQLSGYVLPLNYSSSEQTARQAAQPVSEFLLVPYVGACIHVPPPPPNQMIYIKPEAAIDNPGMFSAVSVSGHIQEQFGEYELFQVDGSQTVKVSYVMDLDAIAPAENVATPQLIGPWWQTLPARVSGVLTQSLASLQSQSSPRTLLLAMLLSFGYGVLHTLGPGHGKAVIVSYFVGHDGSLQRGVVMGVRIAIFHVLSAVVIAILTNTVVQQVGGSSAQSYRIVRLISYSAIALIGGWMLKQAFKGQGNTTSLASGATGLSTNSLEMNAANNLLYPSLSQQLSAPEKQSFLARCNCLTCDDQKGIGGWLALAVGAVPCSGALLVLLYGLANNLLWPSIAMVVSISVGMACTLGWIGAVAIIGNRHGQRLAARRQQKWPWAKRRKTSRFSLSQVGQIIGASCVSLLGIGLFSLTLLTGS